MKKIDILINTLLIFAFSANTVFAENTVLSFEEKAQGFSQGLSEAKRNLAHAGNLISDVVSSEKEAIEKLALIRKNNASKKLPPRKKSEKKEAGIVSTSRKKTEKERCAESERSGKRKSDQIPGKASDKNSAKSGHNYKKNSVSLRKGVVISKELSGKIRVIAKKYKELTGRKLTITSGQRTPFRQARAMKGLIGKIGEKGVQRLYKNKKAVGQVLDANRKNRNNRPAAIKAMTQVIEQQVADGIYISRHLRSGAIDVSRNSNAQALRTSVKQIGGTVFFENDHYHIEFNG